MFNVSEPLCVNTNIDGFITVICQKNFSNSPGDVEVLEKYPKGNVMFKCIFDDTFYFFNTRAPGR